MSTPSFIIDLKSAGKKFFRNWIFRNVVFQSEQGQKISVIGPNGSGKSTFLQVLAGYESLSEGSVSFSRNGKEVSRENIFRHISIAAPYLELIEEYTLEEIVRFHFQFKQPVKQFSTDEIIELIQLENSKDKVFKYFSSGMKQRVRLGLAILSDVDMVLLDEPLSNLDKSGANWYHELAGNYLADKTVVVGSNQNEAEYFFCGRSINIADYK